MSRIDVVEIVGVGRSGSTVLDRLLADALDAPGMGELVAVWRRGVLEDRACSCGDAFSRCSFWQEVVRTSPRRFTPLAAADVVLATNRLMRVSGPMAVRSARSRRALVERTPAAWFDGMEALYTGVAAVADRRRLVDSSKAPVLAYLLAQIPALRVRPVPLVRDPRAVAWAWSHPGEPVALAPPLPELSPARAAIVWSLVTAAAMRVAGVLGGGAARVRYEDLVADPHAVVRRIINDLRLDLDLDGEVDLDLDGEVERVVPTVSVSATDHAMSSNPRVRFGAGPRAVTADRRWERDQTVGSWITVTALALGGTVRHGYPVLPPRVARRGAA